MPPDDFSIYVLDQLRDLRPVVARRMFGGCGLYHHGVFFAISFRERLYFKTTPATRPAYERFGMAPFRPNPRQTLISYYEVPADVLEDAPRLTAWARAALGQQDDIA